MLRREFAFILKKKGKKTGEIAKILETTPAAVSQYLSGKRGKNQLNSQEKDEIKKLTELDEIPQEKICELCKKITRRMNV